jgi:hypothetical protein
VVFLCVSSVFECVWFCVFVCSVGESGVCVLCVCNVCGVCESVSVCGLCVCVCM